MQSVDAQIFARGVFDAMPEKNVVCWTSMVSAYVNSGCSDEARALFERSPVKDRFLWTTMINGYVQYNNVDEAMILFRCMQRDRVKPGKHISEAGAVWMPGTCIIIIK